MSASSPSAKIPIAVNASSASVGGGITYVREMIPELIEVLQRAGASVHLIAGHDVAELLRSTAPTCLTIHTPWWADLPGAFRLSCEQLFLPSLLREMSAAVALHLGDIMPLRATSVPNVILCRNMLLYRRSTSRSIRLALLKRLAQASLHRASNVIFVSDALAALVTGRTEVDKHVTIHHGPGLPVHYRPRLPRDHLRLLIVGSICDYKRVELAIDAVAILKRRMIPLTLTVMGRKVEADYARFLSTKVATLQLEEEVHFTGEGTADEVSAAYDETDIALVTSAYESFCHPIVEALAAGIPVIICHDLTVGGEIASYAGMLSAPDPKALADSIERLFRDPDLYESYSSAGRKRAGDFSWAYTAQRTSSVLLGAMTRPAGPTATDT